MLRILSGVNLQSKDNIITEISSGIEELLH